jgi:hypothetical protein
MASAGFFEETSVQWRWKDGYSDAYLEQEEREERNGISCEWGERSEI